MEDVYVKWTMQLVQAVLQKGLWSLDVDVVLILTSTKSEMFRIYLTNRLLRKSRYAHAHKAQLSNVLVRSFFDVAGTEIQVK